MGGGWNPPPRKDKREEKKPMKSKYFNTFVALYNESVRLDNIDGKINQSRARQLASNWADINLHRNAKEKFMAEWDEFYYHMFD